MVGRASIATRLPIIRMTPLLSVVFGILTQSALRLGFRSLDMWEHNTAGKIPQRSIPFAFSPCLPVVKHWCEMDRLMLSRPFQQSAVVIFFVPKVEDCENDWTPRYRSPFAFI